MAEYYKIIEEINLKLTGDALNDIAFLQTQGEFFKDHRNNFEILRFIGRKIIDLIPETRLDLIQNYLDKMLSMRKYFCLEAKFLIADGNLDDAEKLLLRIQVSSKKYGEGEISCLYFFKNEIQELYFEKHLKPGNEIKLDHEFDPDAVSTLAFLYVEKNEYLKALDLLNDSLKKAPMEIEFLFEKAEILKKQSKIQDFLEISIKCLEIAIEPEYLAKTYRNLGYYFIEVGDYEKATVAYLISSQYEENALAQSQLFYISQMTDEKINIGYYFQNLESIWSETEIQLGSNPKILELIYSLGLYYKNKGEIKQAKKYFLLLQRLTGSSEIEGEIKTIETENGT